jgi:hypothetical protein
MLELLMQFANSDLQQPKAEEMPQIVVTKKAQPTAKKLKSDSVIVSAKKISRPYANIGFKKLDIYTNPSAKADALLAVADLQFSTNNNSAEIVLRGGSPRLSRVYFNDIPIYEAVRGTSLLQTTRSFSVFNTSTISDVETYSTAPPSYFANNAGGAIKIMPDDIGIQETSIQTNLAKSTFVFTRPFSDKSKGFFQTYVDYSNLSPLLAINPDLKELVSQSDGVSIGANALWRPNDEDYFRFFLIGDTENALYPYDLFDVQKKLKNKKNRNYNLFSYEHNFGKSRLKFDFAKTLSDEKTKIGEIDYRNQNQYDYFDSNFSARLAKQKISYRIGANFEDFNLKSSAFNAPVSGEIIKSANYGAIYGFATKTINKNLNLGFGLREYWKNDLDLKPTRQLSAALNDNSRHHNIIIAYGEYGAVLLPKRSAQEAISAASSKQSSIDYKYANDETKFAIGIYHKQDFLDGDNININGIDASFNKIINHKLELSGTMARSLPKFDNGGIDEYGDNYLEYLFKLKAKIILSPIQYINLSYSAMSGGYYTSPSRIDYSETGAPLPVYAKRNNAQLNDYQSFDFSYINQLKFWPNGKKPIYYLNINNLFDKKNQAALEYNSDFTQSKYRHYLSRTIVIGTLFEF